MAVRLHFSLLLLPFWVLLPSAASSQDSRKWIETLRNIQPNDRSVPIAVEASQKLGGMQSSELISVLSSMKGASPLGRNWLSGVAIALHAKGTKGAKGTDPALMNFLNDSSQDGEARYLVFQWVTQGEAELRSKLLEGMLEDSSPEIRYAAIENSLKKLSPDNKKEGLQKLLEAARHPEQVTSVIDLLEKEGVSIVRADRFGFVKNWKLIGPFNNKDQGFFNTEYPVEKDLVQNKVPKTEYEGKSGNVTWKDGVADDKEGSVELNTIYDKEKGAIVYGYALFPVKEDTNCEIRLGCINANKVWVNGELILSNEVYHTGAMIDQYIGSAQLKKGSNKIAIKVCQNEQTESWAQNWAFQLRVCDATGKAILPIKE